MPGVVVCGVALERGHFERWVGDAPVVVEVTKRRRLPVDKAAAATWKISKGLCAPIYRGKTRPHDDASERSSKEEQQPHDETLDSPRSRVSLEGRHEETSRVSVVEQRQHEETVARAEVAAGIARSAVVRAIFEVARAAERTAEGAVLRRIAETPAMLQELRGQQREMLHELRGDQREAAAQLAGFSDRVSAAIGESQRQTEETILRSQHEITRRLDDVATDEKRLLTSIEETVSARFHEVKLMVKESNTERVTFLKDRVRCLDSERSLLVDERQKLVDDLNRERREGFDRLQAVQDSKRASEAATVAVMDEEQRRRASLLQEHRTSTRNLEAEHQALRDQLIQERDVLKTSCRDLTAEHETLRDQLIQERDRGAQELNALKSSCRDLTDELERRDSVLASATAATAAAVAKSAVHQPALEEATTTTLDEDETDRPQRRRRPSGAHTIETAPSDLTMPSLEWRGSRRSRDSEVSDLSLDTVDENHIVDDACRSLELFDAVPEDPTTRDISPTEAPLAISFDDSVDPLPRKRESLVSADASPRERRVSYGEYMPPTTISQEVRLVEGDADDDADDMDFILCRTRCEFTSSGGNELSVQANEPVLVSRASFSDDDHNVKKDWVYAQYPLREGNGDVPRPRGGYLPARILALVRDPVVGDSSPASTTKYSS